MRKYANFLLALVLGVSLFGCKGKDPVAAPAPLVEAVKAVKADIKWDVEYPAQVAGSKDVDVRAQAGGILKQKFFKEGDYVEEGSNLFLIDPTQYQIAVTKAEGSLGQANSDLTRTKRDYDRMNKLYKENAVSRKDYDDSLSAYEKAKANQTVAQGALDDAKVMLGYTTVIAPISGITRNDKYSEGNLISTAGEASFLVNMIQIDPLEIRFSIPGQQWNALLKNFRSGKITMDGKIGDKVVDVRVIMPDGGDYPQAGKVKFVDSTEDEKTGTVYTKADVPNPDKTRMVMPGQRVKIIMQGLVYENAVIVPPSAVLNTAQGSMVYVVGADNVATLKNVSVTQYKDYSIVEGLEGGETVISSGVIKVKPNNPVQVKMMDLDLSAITAPPSDTRLPFDAQQPEGDTQAIAALSALAATEQ